jgi:hypothetical protein
MFFVRALGPGAKLLPLHVSSAGNVKAWETVDRTGTLRIAILNKDLRLAAIGLRLPAPAAATVQWLRGPAPDANTGITLAGQTLDRNANWTGRQQVEPLPSPGGRALLAMPPASGALIEVPHAP